MGQQAGFCLCFLLHCRVRLDVADWGGEKVLRMHASNAVLTTCICTTATVALGACIMGQHWRLLSRFEWWLCSASIALRV
jgi:hypothetical protein